MGRHPIRMRVRHLHDTGKHHQQHAERRHRNTQAATYAIRSGLKPHSYPDYNPVPTGQPDLWFFGLDAAERLKVSLSAK